MGEIMDKVIIDESKRNILPRNVTGVIQDDRIWEQWYDPKIFAEKLPKMSQKDYLLGEIGSEKDRVIIDNRGLRKFTVEQFFQMILKYEKAFSAMKLEKGDVICTIGLTTPEMYAIKYSATSLGLITCNLNVLDISIDDDGRNRLFRQLENVNPKMIFTLDIFESKIYNVINDEKFSRAVKVSMPLDYSVPRYNPERLIIGLKVLKERILGRKISSTISLDTFLGLGSEVDKETIMEVYNDGLPCNISFTSGTTGINKAVLLSHDSNNALAFQHKLGNFGFEKGERNLALVPPFLAFWDADIVHTVLSLGGEELIELTLDYDKIPEYFKKYDVNIGVWSQYLWSSILTLPEDELKRISENLKHPIIGGERCEVNAARKFYEKTGIYQMTGFGATEVNTAFSMTHPYCTKIGTSGIPLPFNNVKIVDESFKDVTYNVPGRLLITGPCLMNGYYNRDDLTKKAIYVDEKGISWYYTGDYAVMDDDGCLTVIDRYIPPVEINYQGIKQKINMLDIVECIKQNENVKYIKMTNSGSKLILHLSLDEDIKLTDSEAIDSIISTIRNNLSSVCWPDFIKVYQDLPRTSVGKVDYKTLTKIGEDISLSYVTDAKLCVIKEDTKVLKKLNK